MRAVALIGRGINPKVVRQFELPGVDIFSGNDLDPADRPAAALIFGGDGTIHRQLPSLIESQTPFLHVPCGSGNDFPVSLGLRTLSDAFAAWQKFVNDGQNTRCIDAGAITPLHSTMAQDAEPADGWSRQRQASESDPMRNLAVLGPRIMQSQLRHLIEREERLNAQPIQFCCIAGAGFDSEVNRRANRMPAWLRGRGGYILGVAEALFTYDQRRMSVSIPAPENVVTRDGWVALLDEFALLVAVGNAPHYGSGMRIAHRALMDDGLLDVCFIRKTGKFKILRLFHTIFSGSHLGMKEVEYRQLGRLRLLSEAPLPVYADGEYVCDTPVEITVMPRVLKAIVP